MPACDICLFFDSETEGAVRYTWRVLRTIGISSPLLCGDGRPHLTLAILDYSSAGQLVNAIRELAGSMGAFPITFSSLATFGARSGVVFLAPTITASLTEAHDKLYTVLGDLGIHSEKLYRPGRWTPHCSLTLGTPPELIAHALHKCLDITRLPLEGWIRDIGLVVFDAASIHSYGSWSLNKGL